MSSRKSPSPTPKSRKNKGIKKPSTTTTTTKKKTTTKEKKLEPGSVGVNHVGHHRMQVCGRVGMRAGRKAGTWVGGHVLRCQSLLPAIWLRLSPHPIAAMDDECRRLAALEADCGLPYQSPCAAFSGACEKHLWWARRMNFNDFGKHLVRGGGGRSNMATQSCNCKLGNN